MMTAGRKRWLTALVVVALAAGGYYAWQTLRSDNLPPGIASGNGRIEAVDHRLGRELRDVGDETGRGGNDIDPSYDEAEVSEAIKSPKIHIKTGLSFGKGRDRVLTCDLTKEYVAINGDYRSLTVLLLIRFFRGSHFGFINRCRASGSGRLSAAQAHAIRVSIA